MSTVTVDVIGELRSIVENAIARHPRSQQAAIGPSQIGTPCDRCLAHMLAGNKPVEHVVPWLPTIGTAVHAWLEQAVREHNFMAPPHGPAPDDVRWLTEERVNVGQVGGTDIWGSADLFDIATGTVIDFKVVGKSTLDKVRRQGASLTYQRQAALYGKGFEDAGRTVTSLAIWFLPRNAVSLQHAQAWTAPYDRTVAEQALARANVLAAATALAGLEQLLATLPEHTGEEFGCWKFPGETIPTPQTPGGDPFAG